MRRYFLPAFIIAVLALSAQAEAPGLSLRGTANVFADNALFDDELLGGPIRPSAVPQATKIIYEEYTGTETVAATPVTYAAKDGYPAQVTPALQEASTTPRNTKDGRPLLSWSGR